MRCCSCYTKTWTWTCSCSGILYSAFVRQTASIVADCGIDECNVKAACETVLRWFVFCRQRKMWKDMSSGFLQIEIDLTLWGWFSCWYEVLFFKNQISIKFWLHRSLCTTVEPEIVWMNPLSSENCAAEVKWNVSVIIVGDKRDFLDHVTPAFKSP